MEELKKLQTNSIFTLDMTHTSNNKKALEITFKDKENEINSYIKKFLNFENNIPLAANSKDESVSNR